MSIDIGLAMAITAASTPSWTPAKLPNLAIWLDAGNTSGVDGANLTTWTDLSGAGFHLNAQDAANVFHSSGGASNRAYVSFSIGALYRASALISGADAARTCYAVVKRGTDGHMCWLDGRYGFDGFGLAFGVGSSGKREISVSGVAIEDDTTSNATTNWEQIGIINTGAAGQRMRVGSAEHTLSAAAAAIASTTRFSVGGNDNGFLPDQFVGGIAEIVICSGVTSAPNIALLEAYLLAKYGV